MRNNYRLPEERIRGLRGGEEHDSRRALFRGAGMVITVVGGIFMLVGGIDFFSAFGSFHQQPTKFWCFFVGMPLLALGGNLLRLGYMGAVSRYVAQETVPVVRDSAVEVAEGLRPTIRDIAADVRSTRPEGRATREDPGVRLARLDKLRADGLINDAEHAEQRARILREL